MKSIETIYQEMLTAFAAASGYLPSASCDLAARLHAAAAQIHSLYLQAQWVLDQSFPQTAQGEYLDYHAQLRAMERKAASCAKGLVRFFGDGASEVDRPIPAGTVCMTPGLVRFITEEDGVLAAGQGHVDVPVSAVLPGIAGNVLAGSVRVLSVPPVGITGCTNPKAMTGGTDAEADEQLRSRILNSFSRLPNGANCAFYEQMALSFDEVAAAVAIPRKRGVGTVDVVLATHEGLPGRELLDSVARKMQSNREIAVDVAVSGPQTVPVDVTVRIAAQDMEAATEQVEQALNSYFTGKLLGKNVLRAKLASLVYATQGVDNYELLLPEQDVAVETDQLPVLGKLTVEAMA